MGKLFLEQMGEELTRKGLQAIMETFSDDLFLFVRSIVNSNETAEELVSDVFVKIWDKRNTFSKIENIRSYLFILARNESISYIRNNKKIKIISIEEVNDYYFTPLESDGSELFNNEVVDIINLAIDELPVKCKLAFSLAKVNGLKYKEIAEIMNISPLTVKNHIAYALEKICTRVGVSKNGKHVSHSEIYFFLFGEHVV